MSEQGPQENSVSTNNRLANMPFTKVLRGFHSSARWEKLALGFIGIVVLFFAGWVMDCLTPASMRVTYGRPEGSPRGLASISDLQAYVSNPDLKSADDFAAYTRSVRNENHRQLRKGLTDPSMNLSAEKAERAVETGTAKARIKSEYKRKLKDSIDTLNALYDSARERDDADPEALLQTYNSLFAFMVGNITREECSPEARAIINREKDIDDAGELAQLYRLACNAEGRGVFATIISFKMGRLHRAANALLREQDVTAAGLQIRVWLRAVCWFFRFHWIYAIILSFISLAVWSVIGGAICRISALQVARDERIGPIRALKFSLSKFTDFFSAPLIPIIVVMLIALVIFLISLIGAIPAVGEIITGIFLGLALFGGFVIALLCVGLIGGVNLMYPTIAVEGSDGFDALSRSFSYVFEKPWHMVFYTGLGAVYGVVCYYFVRFFAFLMLLAVHTSVGLAVNIDGAALTDVRGKLDAMWARPSFDNLHSSVNWISLSGSEAIGAFLIWLWVGLIVALVMAFVISYFFTLNTTIYFLLRRRVDSTDIEDVYVEEDMSELINEQAPEEVAAQDEVPPAEPEQAQQSEPDQPAQDDPSDQSDQPDQPERN